MSHGHVPFFGVTQWEEGAALIEERGSIPERLFFALKWTYKTGKL